MAEGAGKRIVLNTFGSLGDLHPYMAIALELQARGHRAVIASSALYREKIEGEGIGFHAVRPNLPDPDEAREMMRRVMSARAGTEYVFRRLCLPYLRQSYDDLVDALQDADLLVTHPITFAGPIAAAKTGIPWVSSVLSPISFFSAYEPLVLPPSRFLSWLYGLAPGIARGMLSLMRRHIGSWFEPVYRLRAELGLPRGENPAMEGQHSPACVLALWSEGFAPRQPDWPPQARVTGFVFYDHHEGPEMLPELVRFLDEGPAPIVFALGSAAVLEPGSFYRESAAAAERLGQRAVLLVGPEGRGALPGKLPEGVAAFSYAPFSQLFPRAAAIVHHGGIGTTAQALRAGRPMLVRPFSQDQPDNAARITRLGVGAAIARERYTAAAAAAALRPLLEDPRFAARAAEIGRRIRAEKGVRAACDAIEAVAYPAAVTAGTALMSRPADSTSSGRENR